MMVNQVFPDAIKLSTNIKNYFEIYETRNQTPLIYAFI